jgi:hypothetical protein
MSADWVVMGASALVMALAGVWIVTERTSRARLARYLLEKGIGQLDTASPNDAMTTFTRARDAAARAGELALCAAAWRGLAIARGLVGEASGAESAHQAADDGERQIGV